MTFYGFLSLAWQTLIAPQEVARLLLSLRLGREALFLAFATVVVINTILMMATNMVLPVAAPFQNIMNAPPILMLLLGGTLAITAVAITWTGRALGGKARLEDMAILVIWLQALWILVRAAMLVLLPISLSLASLLVFLASLGGLWLLVHFVDAAHEFGSLTKSAFVLLLGVTGMALGLSVIFSLIGATSMGLAGNV